MNESRSQQTSHDNIPRESSDKDKDIGNYCHITENFRKFKLNNFCNF
jgi:hypothetical protein